jgi:hypothetical protein
VRAAATAQVDRWRQVADHPFVPAGVRDAAGVLVWTGERLVAEIETIAPQ